MRTPFQFRDEFRARVAKKSNAAQTTLIESRRLWQLRSAMGNAIPNNVQRRTLVAWLCGVSGEMSMSKMTKSQVYALEEMVLDQNDQLNPAVLEEIGAAMREAMLGQWQQEQLW